MAIASTALFDILTVPSGKRWQVSSVRVFRNSGDNTVDRIYVRDASRVVVHVSDEFTGASTRIFNPGSSLQLEEGDSLGVRAGGVGVAATLFGMTLNGREYDASSGTAT